MKQFRFKSIKTRLVFWFITVALTQMLAISLFSVIQLVPSRKALIFNKLEAVRSLKVREINSWIDQIEGDVKIIADDPQIRGLVTMIGWKDQNSQQKDSDIYSVREYLKRYMKNFTFFDEIFIISTESKKIIVSTNKKVEGRDCSTELYFTGSLQKQGVFIQDIYYSTSEKKPSMTFSIPIYFSFGEDSIGAILAVKINLDASLYQILQNREGMGITGETLIVSKNLMALNTLRWSDSLPLNLKIEAVPAINATKGRTGILETEDYRGEPVLAAYTYLPKTGWGFISKQDIKEVYAPLKELRRLSIITGILTVLIVILIAYMISRSISKPIIQLEEGVEIVGSGNLDYKVRSDSKDEIGRLSRGFDQMTASLKKIGVLSLTDGLTKIANRRHFDEMIQKEWRRSMRRVVSISLIIIDIDYFKLFNDLYGHQKGDDCLKKVAMALSDEMKRPGDFVARYGGEEFVVVLPSTDRPGALVIAENMRENIEKLQIEHRDSKVSDHVTISLGIATIVVKRDSKVKELIELADKALYTAKEQGRNQLQFLSNDDDC